MGGYPRLLTWSHASDLQVVPEGTGLRGFYGALGRLPQVAGISTGELLNMTARIPGGYVPAAHIQVFASPDGRMGRGVDRVKILAGRLSDPADPRDIMINQKLAELEHVRPGSTVRLFGVPNDSHGNPDVRRAFPVTFRVSAIVVFNSQIAPAVSSVNPTALLSPTFLGTATARRVPNSGDEAFVRLLPGASAPGFLRAASALAARRPATTGKIIAIPMADVVAATQRAIRPDAVALALFAALAGLIALAIIGQLLSRQLVLDSAWFGALRALGMTRGRLAALSLARVAAVSAAGGILAVAIAIAASPLMPIGPARLAEPAPGIDVSLAILVAGLAVIVLAPIAVVAPVAWIVSAQRGVTGYADGINGQVTVKGRTMAAIGLTPVRGRGYLTLLAGHPPYGPGQIVLGARTLRSLHLRLGQTVRVTASADGVVSRASHPMRIVGEAVFASLGRRGSFTGTDLGNGAVVAPSLLSTPFPQTGCTATCYNFVLLRYRPGTDLNTAGARLMTSVTRAKCPPGSCSVAADQRPVDIQGYAGIRDTPLILGAMLALLGAAALAHLLVTGVRRRRRDLAILKIVGMRPAQLLRVVSWQAAALTATALIVGIPLGVLAGRWSWVLFASSVGVAPGAEVPALLVVAEAGAALLLAVVIAAVPGRAAARVRPAASLRTE